MTKNTPEVHPFARSVRHRHHCPGVGNGCTTDSCSDIGPGKIVRARGWCPGDVIEGDEGFGPKRLRIQWVGREVVVFTDVLPDGSNGRESAAWTLSMRCWGIVER